MLYDMNLMSPTFAHASPAIIAALVAWLMVRVAEGKRAIVLRQRRHCAACGRQLTRRGCTCSSRTR
jgi:hypothetical protein